MEAIQELKKVVDNQEPYKFITDTLTFSTTELKGEKQAYVTGYISVPDVDLFNDLVTIKALKSMLQQIEKSTITIDYEHEVFRDDNSILPVAKIVEARVDDKGLWIKAILNKNSPKYKSLWGSIKDGFINAFSIAFQPLKTVKKSIGGTDVRLIEELKLLNVAFTGAPVNEGARMTGFGMKSVMLKAISDSEIKGEQMIVPKSLLNKLMEVKNMEEEKKIEEPVEEKPIVEEKPEEPAKPVEEKPKEPEKVVEETPVNEQKALDGLKEMIEQQNKTIKKQAKELKSIQEKAVFKSLVPIQPKTVSVSNIDMLGLIQ